MSPARSRRSLLCESRGSGRGVGRTLSVLVSRDQRNSRGDPVGSRGGGVAWLTRFRRCRVCPTNFVLRRVPQDRHSYGSPRSVRPRCVVALPRTPASVAGAMHAHSGRVYVRVSGMRIGYRRAGSGEPVLFLHGGFGFDSRSWARQLDGLADEFDVVASTARVSPSVISPLSRSEEHTSELQSLAYLV